MCPGLHYRPNGNFHFFIVLLQELNPNVEAPTRRLLEHIRSSLEDSAGNSKGCSIEFKDEEVGKQNMILTLNSQLAGLPFVWKFRGSPSSKEMVSEMNSSITIHACIGQKHPDSFTKA